MKISDKVRQEINGLSYAATSIEAVQHDWSSGYGETWECHEVTECQGEKDGKSCGALVMGSETCEKCGWESAGEYNTGPMMNYYYPIPGFDSDEREAAEKLKDLPLCLVSFNDPQDEDHKWVLALTGGGMDLSWQICEAFMALGYIPPTAFSGRLPEFAGMKITPGKRKLLAACQMGFEAEIGSQTRNIGHLDNLIKRLRKNGRRK